MELTLLKAEVECRLEGPAPVACRPATLTVPKAQASVADTNCVLAVNMSDLTIPLASLCLIATCLIHQTFRHCLSTRLAVHLPPPPSSLEDGSQSSPPESRCLLTSRPDFNSPYVPRSLRNYRAGSRTLWLSLKQPQWCKTSRSAVLDDMVR
ncbi:hypothetical protein DOTSEDRAFT_73381 [Dothistroma septosporum NZE10]|uniref:Uncharacterized protein n=1 Tax=Dothistroma septosporum (strain NZE10 / CBS 128990) TaxID=675120 RepID=N1PJD0_DOTSN|nr:hypothetical protein DOTSEDRAFT_73381 [Dothistroma septosporum NZE10]